MQSVLLRPSQARVHLANVPMHRLQPVGGKCRRVSVSAGEHQRELSTKEKAEIRTLAMNMAKANRKAGQKLVVVNVGRTGLSPNFHIMLADTLAAREVVRVRSFRAILLAAGAPAGGVEASAVLVVVKLLRSARRQPVTCCAAAVVAVTQPNQGQPNQGQPKQGAVS